MSAQSAAGAAPLDVTYPLPDLEATALRFALGDRARLVPFEGGWAGVIGLTGRDLLTGRPIDPEEGAIIVSTGPQRKDALCGALHFATIRRVSFAAGVASMRRTTNPIRGLTPALALLAELKPCPKCGKRTVTAIAFGRTVLGYVCTYCKWERPESK